MGGVREWAPVAFVVGTLSALRTIKGTAGVENAEQLRRVHPELVAALDAATDEAQMGAQGQGNQVFGEQTAT